MFLDNHYRIIQQYTYLSINLGIIWRYIFAHTNMYWWPKSDTYFFFDLKISLCLYWISNLFGCRVLLKYLWFYHPASAPILARVGWALKSQHYSHSSSSPQDKHLFQNSHTSAKNKGWVMGPSQLALPPFTQVIISSKCLVWWRWFRLRIRIHTKNTCSPDQTVKTNHQSKCSHFE